MISKRRALRKRQHNLAPALAFFLALFCAAMFLSDPETYARSVLKGISLWAAGVLPATFPFLFLTALMTALPPFSRFSQKISPPAGKLFLVSGAGAGAAILSAVSGYPVGAKLVSDLSAEGRLGREERFRVACLASTSGPPFLVGTVGAMMFQSAALGWVMLLSHLLGVWTVCFFMRFFARSAPPAAEPPAYRANPNVMYETLYHAVISILCVGGFIALFSCLGDMLASLGLFRLFGESAYAKGILQGLLEMTTGCAALSEKPTALSAALAVGVVTFGGMCVLCQELSYLTRAGVKTLPFLGVKLLQALLAAAIAYPLALLAL